MSNRALDLNWTIPRAGEMIADKYVVEGPCGRGGLAVVLSAMHAELDRRVAIKVLLPEWAGDAEVVERFLREGRAATRIKSEHVVRVFDVGTLASGAPYLVLEYLEGRNLDEVLATWGALPVSTAVDWVLQAAEAIAEAHALGIVHRDLKPANLFLTKGADGTASIKVIDFGLSKVTDLTVGAKAKLTRPNDVMGSPHYMAPEQLRASCDADARTDLWALGAVLHELIAGKPPFQGETLPELCAIVLTAPPERISAVRANVPPGVEQAVLRCLEKEPELRFASVADMARALAPHGTALARASCERIERVLEGTARTSSLSLLPPLEFERVSDPWPSDAYRRVRIPGEPASAKVVVGSFLMFAGLAAAALMTMYESVHAGEAPRADRQVTFDEHAASPVDNAASAEPRAPSTPSPGDVASRPNQPPTTAPAPIAAPTANTAPAPIAAPTTAPASLPAPAAKMPSASTPLTPAVAASPGRPNSVAAVPGVTRPRFAPRAQTLHSATPSQATPIGATARQPAPQAAPAPSSQSPDDLFDGRK